MPIDYEDEEQKRPPARRRRDRYRSDSAAKTKAGTASGRAEEQAGSERIEIEDVATGARISADLATARREEAAAIFNEIAARKLALSPRRRAGLFGRASDTPAAILCRWFRRW